MTRKPVSVTTVVFFVLSISSGLLATEWHVAPPPLGNDSNPGTSALPFATIQHGIDASSDGDKIIVAEGTYVENIRFGGSSIILRSANPNDPAVLAATVIDGNDADSVVTFNGTENASCVLSGFTIGNGSGYSGGGISGGASPNRTHATIRNNVITRNWADEEGGGGCGEVGTPRDDSLTSLAEQAGGEALCPGSGLDSAIFEADDAAGVLGDFFLVGDDDNGATFSVEATENVHDFLAGF